jgi:ketosteroid isomerase-like protein
MPGRAAVAVCCPCREALVTRLALLVSLLLASAVAHADALPGFAERFIAAFHAMHEASATAADVDRLLGLCTDDVVYEHARVGAVVRGKSQLRAGFVAHLGEIRADKTQVVRSAQGPRFVAIEVLRTFEVNDGDAWKPMSRKQLLILERNDQDRIRRVLDDW